MRRRFMILALAMGTLVGCTPGSSGSPTAATGPSASADAPTSSPVAVASPPAASPPAATSAPEGEEDCPTRDRRIRRDLRAIDLALEVGGHALAQSGSITSMARNGAYAAADSIPAYAFLDLDMEPIEVAAGEPIAVLEREDRLASLTGTTTTPFDGFTFDGLPQYAGPDPTPLDAGVVDGRGWIEAPDQAGTWVVEFSFSWETECYAGSGVNWVVVRTR